MAEKRTREKKVKAVVSAPYGIVIGGKEYDYGDPITVPAKAVSALMAQGMITPL